MGLAVAFGVASSLVWGLRFNPQVRADSSVVSAKNLPDRFFPNLSPDRLSPSPSTPESTSDHRLEELPPNLPQPPEPNARILPSVATPSNSASKNLVVDLQREQDTLQGEQDVCATHTLRERTGYSHKPDGCDRAVASSQISESENSTERQNLPIDNEILISEREILNLARENLNREQNEEKNAIALAERRESETLEEQREESEDIQESEPLEILDRPEELETIETNEPALELTLADTVILALQNNRDIKNAYLDRILDRQDLAVAEDRFNPDFTPELSVEIDRDFSGENRTHGEAIRIGGGINWRVPSGGTFSVNLQGVGNARRQSGGLRSDRNSVDGNFSLTFRQPFLRNFGTDVNRAPIEIARLVEASNLWDLKSTLIDTITNAIQSYRELLQAQQQLNIEERALESAKEQLERTQALIEAGRTARVERVPNETAIANREVSVLNAQNRLQSQQLSLIEVLDIDRTFIPVAIEVPQSDRLEEISFEEEALLQVALAQNPSYQQTLLQLDREQLQLLIAENDRLWNLDVETSLTGDLSSELSDRTDFRAGVVFSREFGNLSREQAVERSQIQIQQLENDIEEARESLAIDVRNAIRDVRDNFRQVQLARRARELSEQQLANEQRRLELGRGSIIEVVRFEDALVRAENGELNATISYLNSLTFLEQTIGITLEEWGVTIE